MFTIIPIHYYILYLFTMHTMNPRHKIFAKGWVAQKNIVDRYLNGCAKIFQDFQGLGPKRLEYYNADWVYASMYTMV